MLQRSIVTTCKSWTTQIILYILYSNVCTQFLCLWCLLTPFSVDVETLTVINWQFHQQRGTGWKCIPSPNENGVISLDSALGWLNWTGSSGDPIMFDVGARGVQLEKIEFTGKILARESFVRINLFCCLKKLFLEETSCKSLNFECEQIGRSMRRH